MILKSTVLSSDVMTTLSGGLDQQRADVARARKRTMNKVLKFASGLIKKKLAAETGLPQKAFKGRVIIDAEDDGSEGLVWIGTYSISPYGISTKVLQTNVGIRAGRVSFAGAFKPGGNKSTDKRVFIRKASKHFDADRYTKPAFGSGPGYPIVAVAEEIEPAAEAAIDLSSPEIEQRFATIFQRELNFALEHEEK